MRAICFPSFVERLPFIVMDPCSERFHLKCIIVPSEGAVALKWKNYVGICETHDTLSAGYSVVWFVAELR